MPKDWKKLSRLTEDLQKAIPRAVRLPDSDKRPFHEWFDGLDALKREDDPAPASSQRTGIPGPTDPADQQESAGGTGPQVAASMESGATGPTGATESAQQAESEQQGESKPQVEPRKLPKKQVQALAIACDLLFPDPEELRAKTTTAITEAVNDKYQRHTGKHGKLITDKPMAEALGRKPDHVRRKPRRNI